MKIVCKPEEVLEKLIPIIKELGDNMVDVVIKPHKDKCTEQQRKYYWSVIVKYFQKEVGEHVPMCVHSALKEQVLIPMFGVQSTEELNTAEREDYHHACRGLFRDMFAGEIPLPNESEI